MVPIVASFQSIFRHRRPHIRIVSAEIRRTLVFQTLIVKELYRRSSFLTGRAWVVA